MNTHVRNLLAGVAVMIPLTLDDVSLGAQSAQDLQLTVSVLQDWQREHAGWGNSDVRITRELEDALRGHGFRPDRLTRRDMNALDRTFAQLFPEQDARRYRRTAPRLRHWSTWRSSSLGMWLDRAQDTLSVTISAAWSVG